MIKKEDVVAILDEARQGQYDKLHVLLGSLVRERNPQKSEIVADTLLTVLQKLNSGEPSVLLAPQLSGIIRIHRLRISTRERKQTSALTADGDEQLERYKCNESSDPAHILETYERVDQEIAALVKMKEREPRQFAILIARHQGIPDSEYLMSVGEDLTPDALRQLRARAKMTAAKTIQEIRKASES